jgi:hypothetical protein
MGCWQIGQNRDSARSALSAALPFPLTERTASLPFHIRSELLCTRPILRRTHNSTSESLWNEKLLPLFAERDHRLSRKIGHLGVIAERSSRQRADPAVAVSGALSRKCGLAFNAIMMKDLFMSAIKQERSVMV